MMEYNPRTHRSFRRRLLCAIWLAVNQTVFRFSPFFLHAWRTFLLRCFGAKIGTGVRIKRTVVLKFPWNLAIGDESMVCDNARIFCEDEVCIGRRVQIGEETWLITGSHDVNTSDFKLVHGPIVVGDNAWIATKAIVLKNVRIGEGAVVGAGALVTRDIPNWKIVGGNPAREIGERKIK